MDNAKPISPEQERAEIEAEFRKRWTAETYNPLGDTLQKAVWLGFVQGYKSAKGATPAQRPAEPPPLLVRDDPIAMVNDSPVRRLELAAMRAYRAKYPDGPTWLNLHIDTRRMCMETIEQKDKPGQFNP